MAPKKSWPRSPGLSMPSTSTPAPSGACGATGPRRSPVSASSPCWPPSTTSTSGSSASTPTRSKPVGPSHPRAWAGRILLAALAAGALLTLGSCSLQQPLQAANQAQDAVGKPAPDFAGTDLDGHPIRLSDYRGHPLLINFWASWCGPCRAEQPGLQAVVREFAPQGLEVLGITVRDNIDEAKIFRDEFKMPYRSLFDQAARLAYAYQADAPPTSIFIDAEGVERLKTTGALTEDGSRHLSPHNLPLPRAHPARPPSPSL